MPARTSVAVALFGLLAAPGLTCADALPKRTENVVIVTLDGFRHQEFFGGADRSLLDATAGGVPDVEGLKRRFWRDTAEARRETLLPFIWGTVAKQGQIFGDRTRKARATLTNGQKFSYPGYSEMFCGFADDRINSNNKVPNPNRSVLEFLNDKPGLKGRVAAFCTWDVFPFIFRSTQNGLLVHAGWVPIADEPLSERQRLANLLVERLPHYWPDNAYDAITMEAAREHLRKHQPRVLFIGLGETDEWAHGRRYDLYLRAAYEADRFLEELWHMLEAMPHYRGKTALVVTTDHGRGSTRLDWISHGPGVAGAEDIWIAVMGPDTPALGVRAGIEVTQSQVAATVAGLLGEDYLAASPKSAPALSGVCASATSSAAK